MALVVLTFWVFIGRGGVVLPFPLVPILPFIALSDVIEVWAALRRAGLRAIGRRRLGLALAAGVSAVLMVATCAQYLAPEIAQVLAADPLQGRQQAVAWIRICDHLPKDSRLIIDMSMWMSLHDPGTSGAPTYPRAQ